MRYARVFRIVGVAGSLYGLYHSGNNIYVDYQRGGISNIDRWDVADLSIGGASLLAGFFLASNPVGWVIVGGASVYFLSREIYEYNN